MKLPVARFKVKDRSMEPALREGASVLVNRWAYLLREPAVGDVVVAKHPTEERFLVKRVAKGEPGGCVLIGDNEDYSVDSREFGPVDNDLIVGKVLFQRRIDRW